MKHLNNKTSLPLVPIEVSGSFLLDNQLLTRKAVDSKLTTASSVPINHLRKKKINPPPPFMRDKLIQTGVSSSACDTRSDKVAERYDRQNGNEINNSVIPIASRRSSAEVMKRLFEEALAIESEDAKRAGTIGYMGRVLVQTTLPYREPRNSPPAWGRRNGNVSLVIQPGYTIRNEVTLDRNGKEITQRIPVSIGYPYGNIPRLVLAWLSTEAVRTQSRSVLLGRSLREFMESIGLESITGGKNGSITRLREQLGRLFASTIAVVRDEALAGNNIQSLHTAGFRLTDQASVWWDAQRPEQAGLFQSEVTLSEKFYEELTEKPVPVDLRALRALKQSPIALDIYSWLTWRNSFLRNNATIPWEALMGQFGSESSPKKFRENFKKALMQVQIVYPAARVNFSPSGLILIPSPTSVAKIQRTW